MLRPVETHGREMEIKRTDTAIKKPKTAIPTA